MLYIEPGYSVIVTFNFIPVEASKPTIGTTYHYLLKIIVNDRGHSDCTRQLPVLGEWPGGDFSVYTDVLDK